MNAPRTFSRSLVLLHMRVVILFDLNVRDTLCYIYSPRIYLLIVPYAFKWMDRMKRCFSGLCYAFYSHLQTFDLFICLLCCVNITGMNILILFVFTAWNYVISHE